MGVEFRPFLMVGGFFPVSPAALFAIADPTQLLGADLDT